LERQRVALILNQLLDDGVNVIDTAASYAGSEEAIGNAREPSPRRIRFCEQVRAKLRGSARPAWSPQLSWPRRRALKRLKDRPDRRDVAHSCGLEIFQKDEA